MKILLVARGSSGDVFPYFSIAAELVKRRHEVVISIPKIFEKEAQAYNFQYVLQDLDELGDMMDGAAQKPIKLNDLLRWTRDVIDYQFTDLIPLVNECDLFISTNTEFATPSIAECCNKPLIRTAYAPFLPGKQIPPPIFPFPKPGRISASLLWKVLNISANIMSRKSLNKHRAKFGVYPIKNYGHHAPTNSYNLMLYSPVLGTVDPEWKYDWSITGYCFNDTFPYDETAYRELMSFIKKDERPTLFFTLGSCSSKKGRRFVDMLSEICNRNEYKLVIGAGWANTGFHLDGNAHLYIMKTAIPHSLIFSACDAVIHHGGCGTTHNVARSGKPQMITPLIIDQHYWGYRVGALGLGPKYVSAGKISAGKLERKVKDLMLNPEYRENARIVAGKLNREKGVEAFCDYIESNFALPSQTSRIVMEATF